MKTREVNYFSSIESFLRHVKANFVNEVPLQQLDEVVTNE